MKAPIDPHAVVDLIVAVVAKECLPGRVKTRLTPPLSRDEAALLARISLGQTLDTVRKLPVATRLLVMDGLPSDDQADGFRVMGQPTGSLDERLAAVCDASNGPLLIIGMDTPQLTAEHLAPLFRDWLSDCPGHDAWLGGADDGGFWALALHRPDGGLIRGVQMSTSDTGVQQRARLVEAGLSVGVLPRLRDMDSFADALYIAAGIPQSGFAAAVHALNVRPGQRHFRAGGVARLAGSLAPTGSAVEAQQALGDQP